jgi:hypothetical protein
MQHTIPLTVPIKMGKGFNWNTNATFTEKWYLQHASYGFEMDTVINKMRLKQNNAQERGMYALHDMSLSTSLTSKIYITGLFNSGGIVRDVMTPDLNFTFRPDLSGKIYGKYFNTITGREEEFYLYAGAIYGGVTSKMQAISRITVNNNLEIKVRSKKDTITGMRKITIFDNLSISCGYDFAADSLNWQPLTITGRTSLFSFLDVNFRLSFDPYIINNQGKRVNQTESVENHRLLRFSESDLNLGLNWRLNRDFFTKMKKVNKDSEQSSPQVDPIFSENGLGILNTRTDFNNPWNVILNYTFRYITTDNLEFYKLISNKKYNGNIIQTITIQADVSITRKWKVGITTGYDIQNRDFTYTKIEIYRDLHCWEMKLAWIPFGFLKGWNFQINVKAPVLQDLKYSMKKDFRDNISY